MRKMRAALDGLFIEGLKNNIPLHKVILNDETFISGHYSTAYIEQNKPQEKIDTSFDHKKVYRMLAAVEARRLGI
jgi:acetyl/propionyl-CoA carboxylase alpha subunit